MWLKLFIVLIVLLMFSFFFSCNLIVFINSLKEIVKKFVNGNLVVWVDVLFIW